MLLLGGVFTGQKGFCFNDSDKKAKKSGPITYQEIGDSYLSSFGLVGKQPAVKSEDAFVTVAGKKKLNLVIPILSETEKLKILFDLLASQEHIATESNFITDANRIVLEDLDVYRGQGKDIHEHVMSKLAGDCRTVFGQAYLAYALAHPTTRIEDLQARQALIKELIENEKLAEEIDALLKTVKNAESGFFSFYREDDPVSKELYKQLYFNKPGFKNLNNNKYALEALVRLYNAGTVFKCTSDIMIFVGSLYVAGKAAAVGLERMGMVDPATQKVPSFGIKDALVGSYKMGKSFVDPREYIAQFKEVENQMELISAAQVAQGLPALSELQMSIAKKTALGMFGLKAGLAGFYLVFKGMALKTVYDQAKQTNDSLNYMQTRLIDSAAIILACESLYNLANLNPVMSKGLQDMHTVCPLFEENLQTNFAILVDQLRTNTFKGSASFFSLSGKVLSSFKLMNEERNHFAPVVTVLGEIDACLAIAKLYKKMRGERVGYCFVNFVETPKPYLNLIDFWNPFISKDIVVTNSLEMGSGTDVAKIILTGSNTGGKSTILKGMMISLWLAHTFGIAPAKKCTLSPFTFIGSYLRVNDDIAAGESKFKAEVLRAKMLCDTMDSLPHEQFGFVVIDELFTGTGSEKAAIAASKIASKLAGLENNIYILATHFPLLTELEKGNPGILKNFKVDVYKDDSGSLVRPFKLEPGISSNNIAIDILNEEIKDIDFSI